MGWEAPLTRTSGIFYEKWPPAIFLFTAKMRKNHRHFFYAHPENVFEVLYHADPDAVAGKGLEEHERLHLKFDVCRWMIDASGRFRVALRGTDCVLDRCVCMDLVSMEWRNVLHAVDMFTKYSAACFLLGKSSRDILRQ